MARQRLSLTAKKGTDELFSFTVKDSAGTALNLAGVISFSSSIRQTMDSASSLGSFSYEASLSTLAQGVVVMKLAASLSNTLPEISFYEISYIDAGGLTRSMSFGTLTILK